MTRILGGILLVALVFMLPPHAEAASPGPEPAPAPTPWEPAPEKPYLTAEAELTDAIQESDPFGYLGSTSSVTYQGEYTTQIPIVVPPSFPGMSPSLAIGYSSSGGDGLLGVGVSLRGLSEIGWCGQTFAVDGKATPTDYSPDSHFCLDGQPLVLVDGVYGEAESEYRTERDGFAKIQYFPGNLFEPGHFTVYAKDGHILRYEGILVNRAEVKKTPPYTLLPAGLVNAVFPLKEIEDRAGHRILYEYTKIVNLPDQPDFSTLEYFPESIAYVRGSQAYPRRAIRFSYEDRPDPSFSFLAGVRLKTTKRLKAIELYAPNPSVTEKVGSYQLTYGTSIATQRSLLRTVSRCDAKGVCLPAKEFKWETSLRPDFGEIEVGAAEFPINHFVLGRDTSLVVYDMDGDGADEVLYKRGAEYFFRKTSAAGVPLGDRFYIDPLISAANSPVGFENIRLDQSRPVDIDGDGDTELFAAQVTEASYHLFAWNPDAGGVASTGLGMDAPLVQEGNGDPHLGTIAFGDTSGRGLPDLFYQYFLSEKQPRWSLLKNIGGDFDDAIDTDVPAYCARSARVIDTDGDGLAEVWNGGNLPCDASIITRFDPDGQPITDDQTGLGYEAKRALFADLNGDGLRDLVRPANGGGWIRWNTGVGFGPKEPLENGPEPDGNATQVMDQGTHVVDINGDSREDILAFRYTPSPKIIAYLSLGDGAFNPVEINTLPGALQAIEGFTMSRPGDFNADGLLDIVKVDFDGVMRVLLQKPGVVDVIHEVWDKDIAEHPREIITYSNAWSDAPKPASCAYPQRCIHHGLPVVRQHQTWQGKDVGAFQTKQYSYEDPRLDVRGRGFLGFGEMRIWDADRLSETSITFDNETRLSTIYPYAGLPKTILQITPIWEDKPSPLPAPAYARVSLVKNTHAIDFQNALKTHSVQLASWTSKEWEQKVIIRPDGVDLLAVARPPLLRERHGANEYDEYGNTTKAESETKDGVYRRVETEYYDADTEKWLLALPKKTRVIVAKSGAGPLPEPRTTEFRFDPDGHLERVSVEPASQDDSLKSTTTCARNSDAQVTQVTWEAPGEAPRHLNIEYDKEEGIFPVHAYNDLGFSQTSLYHPAYGVLVKSTDINGVETHRTYDGFGRPRRVETDSGGGVEFSETPYIQDGSVLGLIQTVHSDTGAEVYTVVNEVGRTLEQGTRSFDGLWSITATTYNVLGQPVAETRPALGVISPHKTVGKYDSLDRLVEVTATDGAKSRREYSFFKTTSWDADNHESYVVRDLDDRIVESADVLNGKVIPTSYVYGDFDQLEVITDIDQNETVIGYDHGGRQTSLTDPDRGVVTFGLNGFGEVLWEDNDLPQKNTLGKAISYGRDALGRVTTKLDVDGLSTSVYDQGQGAFGQLTEAMAPDGTKTSLTYDVFGRPRSSTWTIAGKAYTINTHYGFLGRLDRVEYPEVPGRPGPRFAVDYAYNEYDYLESVKNPWLATAFWEVKQRNADGALTKAAYGNGVVNTRSYKPLTGQLDVNEYAKKLVPFEKQKQTYYPNGSVHERIDLLKNRSEVFRYDNFDRLTQWTVTSDAGSRETGYEYSDIGNLLAVTVNQGVSEVNTYGLDGKPHALSTTLQGDYIPDELGRTVQGGGRTIAFTAFDLPKTITPESGPADAVTFGYDAFQRRVQKVTKAGSTIFVGGLYERRESGSSVEHVFFVPGDGGRVAEVHFTEGAQADTTLYLHQDALGSVRRVTDEGGTPLKGPMYFEPFGQRVMEDGSPIPQNYTPPVDVGFIGAHHDDDVGFIDLGGRIYDPMVRRFWTPDPIVGRPLFGQSYNRYAYSLNNPVNFSDPSGFDPAPVGCGEKNDCLSVKAPNLGPEPRVAKKGASKAAAKGTTPAPTMAKADPQETSAGAAPSTGEAAPSVEAALRDSTGVDLNLPILEVQLPTGPGSSDPFAVMPPMLSVGYDHPLAVLEQLFTGDPAGGRTYFEAYEGGFFHDLNLATSDRFLFITLRPSISTFAPPSPREQAVFRLGTTGVLALGALLTPGPQDDIALAAEGVERGGFSVGSYRPSASPLENHHGVLDVWASHNIPGYVSRGANTPTIALTEAQHAATKAVYRDWLFEQTGRRVGGSVTWSQVNPREIQGLTNRMFDAAGVPASARGEYFRAFHQYIYGVVP